MLIPYQAPLDKEGEQIVQNKRVICVSQLSLVDLAGSERTNRSKNTGQRLREAGNLSKYIIVLLYLCDLYLLK